MAIYDLSGAVKSHVVLLTEDDCLFAVGSVAEFPVTVIVLVGAPNEPGGHMVLEVKNPVPFTSISTPVASGGVQGIASHKGVGISSFVKAAQGLPTTPLTVIDRTGRLAGVYCKGGDICSVSGNRAHSRIA